MTSLHAGLSGEKEIEVTLAVSATHMGSGSMGVFATPAMVGLIERTAMELVQPALGEGETTVGVEVSVRHLAATPLGMRVRAQVVLESIEGRFLNFSAQVFDEKEKVGEGTHKRAIIRSQNFMARVREKSA
jgi:fluoroacetyl-CoA thioesterase